MESRTGESKKNGVELKRSENTLSKVNRTLEAVFRCGLESAKIKEESDLLHGICRIIVKIGGYSLAWIGTCGQDKKQNFRPVAKAAYDKRYFKRWELIRAIAEDDRGPAQEAIRTVKPCIARNMSLDNNDVPQAAEANKHVFASFAALPLFANGQALGALNICSLDPNAFDAPEIKILEQLANNLSYDIAARRELEALRRVEEDLLWEVKVTACIAKLANQLIMPRSIEDISSLILGQAKYLTNSQDGYIGYFEPKTGYFVCNGSCCNDAAPAKFSEKNKIIKTFSGQWGQILKSRKSLMANMPTEDAEALAIPLGSISIQQFLSAPAEIEKKLVGRIGLANSSRDYSDRDLILVKRLAVFYALAIQRSRMDKALSAVHDNLEEKVQERTKQLAEANIKLRMEVANRKIAQEEMKKAKNYADAANRAKSEFLANMSHELRTPLNHIIGFTELILDKDIGELNKIQFDYLTDVRDSSYHLLSLINDILDLSKIEAGRQELQILEVDLKKLLDSSLVMVKEKALKHSIRMSLDTMGIPDVINADERLLKQIIYNLLSNAVKFVQVGGKVSVTAQLCEFNGGGHSTDSSRQCRGVKFSVSDTGIGLKSDDLDRIFNPFDQVEGSLSRRFQGTGLGLSLSKKLVQLHGGKIWAESEGEGKGSTFSFIIPLANRTEIN